MNEQLKRDFRQRLDALCRHRSDATVFQDWVEVAAICLHQAPYNQGLLPKDAKYEELEARYMAFVPKYERQGLTVFSEMLGIAQLALCATYSDFLGELYEELDLTGSRERQKRGEFFTPRSLSTLMAKLCLDKEFIEQAIAEKGYLSISEPACGFGGMVIETCKQIEELGFSPSQMVWVEATDISRLSFHAAYLQLSILGIPAIVRHGNTLSNEMYSAWLTPILQLSWKRGEIALEVEASAEPAPGKEESAIPSSATRKTVAEDTAVPKESPPPVESSEQQTDSAEITHQLELFSDWKSEEG